MLTALQSALPGDRRPESYHPLVSRGAGMRWWPAACPWMRWWPAAVAALLFSVALLGTFSLTNLRTHTGGGAGAAGGIHSEVEGVHMGNNMGEKSVQKELKQPSQETQEEEVQVMKQTTPPPPETVVVQDASKLDARLDLSEWEVIFGDPVYVRAFKDAQSKVLGKRLNGTMVAGRVDGDWLRLANGKGYMIISNGYRLLRRRRRATYSRVTIGMCADYGKFPIHDVSVCEAAATALGLPDTTVELQSWVTSAPTGCYYKGLKLWMNVNRADAMHPGAGHGRDVLCSDHGDPATVTTTTHTTTVTTRTATSMAPITATPKLYCFEVVRLHSWEADLVSLQLRKRASIFACNEWTVFGDAQEPLDFGVTGLVGAPESENVGSLKAAYSGFWHNTDNFLRVWRRVIKERRYRHHEWTVKVDSDAVFLPDRLRLHLKRFMHKQNVKGWTTKIYFKNCRQFGSMQGPLEILSKAAVDSFHTGLETRCKTIDTWSLGEDQWISKCLDALGMWAQPDYDLLTDQYCGGNPTPCTDGWKVAFHPFKPKDSYENCLREATS